MASTLTTSKVASTVQARAGLDITSVTATYTQSAAFVVNDVVQMVKVPMGATILEVILSTTDLDTDATPAIVLEVGDGGDVDRYIAGSTVGQAGGLVRLSAHGGHGYTYTADDTIDIKVSTAPDAGSTDGTLTLTVIYTMQF